jgi:mono/diheme cytochrome c family protein
MVFALGVAHAAERPDVAAGRRIAQQNCGGCHATGAGSSPLPGAPPFRELHRRYPVGGLDHILQEGMLADSSQEEGGATFHPRMPSVRLDVDQIADLKAYLRSLDPRR